ncbi:hypothetical protein F2Q70_00003042 [Brassica cretica]|uniref:Uncharacterized protein n=1 Tax=Brassica cretica TaxID=69181 RepID=A0A8S9IR61_BRACR|nr:hypothetical protein F2Q70_00003042 [Brassica cretica]
MVVVVVAAAVVAVVPAVVTVASVAATLTGTKSKLPNPKNTKPATILDVPPSRLNSDDQAQLLDVPCSRPTSSASVQLASSSDHDPDQTQPHPRQHQLAIALGLRPDRHRLASIRLSSSQILGGPVQPYKTKRGSAATPRGHSSWERRDQRKDVIRATGPSRSHFQCPELESRSLSDVSQRPREVARVFCGWERRDQSNSAKSLAFLSPGLENRSRSDVIRVTRLSRSHFCLRGSRIALGATSRSDHVRSLAFSIDQSDFSQRPREVARVFCRSERRLAATTPGRSRAGPVLVSKSKLSPQQSIPHHPFPISFHPKQGTMVRKTKGKSDAERQEPESQESSLRGKALASEQLVLGHKGLLDSKPWLQRRQRSKKRGQERV